MESHGDVQHSHIPICKWLVHIAATCTPAITAQSSLVKVCEEVDGKDMRFIQFVAIASLHSTGGLLRGGKLQEEIAKEGK